MEAAPGAQPAVTGFLLGQLRRLSDEADQLERMASERGSGDYHFEVVERIATDTGRSKIILGSRGLSRRVFPSEQLAPGGVDDHDRH